jgi:hypothetical protein
MDGVMLEEVVAHWRALCRAEREAFSEYQLFLETSPLSQKGTLAESYIADLTDLQARLTQAESVRKLFDATLVLARH